MPVMPVLHTAPSLDNRMGGSVHAALNICKMLVDAGKEVDIAATTAPDDDVAYLNSTFAEVPHRLFPRRFPHHYFNSPMMGRWLRRNVGRYALVDIHGVNSFVALYAAVACRRRGVPYLVRPHGSLDPFDLRKHQLAKSAYGPLVLRRLLRGAAAVVLTSELEADRLVTFGARPHSFVMPLPVHLPRSRGDGARFRQHHGIPPNALVVLFLGRLDQKKGLQFLIPSLASLKSEVADLWFLLVGSGEPTEERKVNELLMRFGMADWTTRCRFLSGTEKYSALQASHLFALPSQNENFGIVVVEAMHAGLPLLLSREVYIHGPAAAAGAAELCEPDTSSCRDALKGLISDRSRLVSMGARSQRVAEEHFSVEAARAPLLRLYEEISASAIAHSSP